MVTLLLDSDALEVSLSPLERALSRRRGSLLIPRDQIEKAMLTEHPSLWLRGVPQPGTTLPGGTALGTWKSETSREFAVVRRRKPGVVLDLAGHDTFDRVILSTSHGLELVKALGIEDSTFDESA